MAFLHRFSPKIAARQTVTADDHRVTQAHLEELGKETGHLGARVAALEDRKGEL